MIRRIAFRIAVALVVAGGVFIGTLLYSVPSKGPLSETEIAYENLISQEGGKAAYMKFSESVKNEPPARQHELAHSFGAALFTSEGKSGLSVCDSAFSYGCFHEFLGRAITAHGLSVTTELNQGCRDALVESPLSCQHGIGHGILSYLGYDEKALKRSLEECLALPYNDPIGGCYGGVFMEYNLQTMLGRSGRIRPLTDDEQYPCDALESEFRAACYFWQPQWWRQMLLQQGVDDDLNAYARIGSFCRAAGPSHERSCFEGVGNNVPADADFDAKQARELCDAAAETSVQRLYCRSLAANSLGVGGAGKKGDAEAVCDGLNSGSHDYCISYARNLLNIAVPGEIK